MTPSAVISSLQSMPTGVHSLLLRLLYSSAYKTLENPNRLLPLIHSLIIRLGVTTDRITITKLLEFCSRIAPNSSPAATATAVAIFSNLTNPDIFQWTALMRSFLTAKYPHNAIHCYDQMRASGILPYKFSLVFALKATSLVGDCRKGSALHASVVILGLKSDVYVRSALIRFYCGCGDLDGGVGVFEEMDGEKNLAVWNAMLSGCFGAGDMRRGKTLFDKMPERDLRSWNVVVNGFCKVGKVDVARNMFDEMPQRDLWSWSGMIAGYAQSGRAMEALSLFKEMILNGIRPDKVTLSTALAGCAQVGAIELGKWIHSYVGKNMVDCDVVLGTSLVDMYAKCGNINLALQVFHGMAAKNVTTWNSMICGLAMHGHGNHSLSLFNEMEMEHVLPNDVTFVGVLSACCHIGAVMEGRCQFDRMRLEFNIIPKIEHYGCMVDLLGRAGLTGEARDLILNMPMEPTLPVLGAYLSACRTHGDLDPGEWFLGLVSKLDPGDGWCHVLLSNIYASRNQWREVMRVRKLMKSKGVQKVPGCSCIEVNSIVHEFVMGDKSHPNCLEVFDTIDRLKLHTDMDSYVHII